MKAYTARPTTGEAALPWQGCLHVTHGSLAMAKQPPLLWVVLCICLHPGGFLSCPLILLRWQIWLTCKASCSQKRKKKGAESLAPAHLRTRHRKLLTQYVFF